MESKSIKKLDKRTTVTPNKSSPGYRKQASPSTSRFSPATAKLAGKSPGRISWMRVNDEELLNRLKSISLEPTNKDDCGNCMNEIMALVQDKLQALLQEKIDLRSSIRLAEEQMRMLNDVNTKNKSELHASNTYLSKLVSSNQKTLEEIRKLEMKIGEIDDQLSNLIAHQQKAVKKEIKKLENDDFEQVKAEVQESLDNENAIINEAIKEENDLGQLLKEKTEEAERLKAEIAEFNAKETNRIYSLKSVTAAIEGYDPSKSLSKSFK